MPSEYYLNSTYDTFKNTTILDLSTEEVQRTGAIHFKTTIYQMKYQATYGKIHNNQPVTVKYTTINQ